MTIMYHAGNRALQDQFGSRRIADRLEEKLTRTAFTEDDKAFIESCFAASPETSAATASAARRRALSRADCERRVHLA